MTAYLRGMVPKGAGAVPRGMANREASEARDPVVRVEASMLDG